MRHETRLDYATVTLYDGGCFSTFHSDGSSWAAQPHDTPDYLEIATRCGYLPCGFPGQSFDERAAEARLAYCREHEVFHHIAGAVFYGGPSPVLWALAHGGEVEAKAAALEESMVQMLQRWVRAGERPIIGGVDWEAIRLRALVVLDA